MNRNLVLLCDGTNNQFGPNNTNVVRLAQSLVRYSPEQLLYYDPGVGTLPEPGVVIGKKLWKVLELAFGIDLIWKVREAYSHLMNTWQPGDRVFLFGFSRGAYTARVLAAALHALGLLPPGSDNLVPYALGLFQRARREVKREEQKESGWWKLCREFRLTFARPASERDKERRFPVHFLGIWDTVSSVGWVYDPARYFYTAHNPSIRIIRHAVAIDERRAFFRQNLMDQTPGQDLLEVWFAGVHADVGGGYPEQDNGLWRPSFDWILQEAEKAQLLVDPQRVHAVLHKTKPWPRPWRDRPHQSLTPLWAIAEFVPKFPHGQNSTCALPRLNLGRPRFIHEGALIDESALIRIRETNYAPANMSKAFLRKVRALASVPATLPYSADSSL